MMSPGAVILVLTIFQSTTLRQIVAQSFDEVTASEELESSRRCDATKLSDQIADGKWKNYDFVLDNCLIWTFIEEDINFYAILRNQKSLTTRLSDYHRDAIRHPISASERGNKIKLELALKARSRESNRVIMKLNKLSEESEMQVALVEVEIRDFMDRCNLALYHQREQRSLITDCAKMKERTLDGVKQLCDRLRGQNAILMAMMLDRQVKFN